MPLFFRVYRSNIGLPSLLILVAIEIGDDLTPSWTLGLGLVSGMIRRRLGSHRLVPK